MMTKLEQLHVEKEFMSLLMVKPSSQLALIQENFYFKLIQMAILDHSFLR